MRIIGGEFGGRVLVAPKGGATRPTADRVREAIFSMLESRGGVEGKAVLDLFAGSGAMGLEALSRGARSVRFVEKARPALSVLQANIETLGVADRVEIVRGDATRLSTPDMTFDLVFLDPPYGKGLAEKALKTLAQDSWLSPQAVIIIEESTRTCFVAPDLYTEFISRIYGDTEIIFLKIKESS